MTIEEQIRASAEFVVVQLQRVSTVAHFGYTAESVAWVDGFIERQRVRPDLGAAGVAQLVQNLGSYLGECVISCYGGAWRPQNGTWAVAFNDANAVFPFNKVAKQFANGRGDSIRAWFETIPVIFAAHIRPTSPPRVE